MKKLIMVLVAAVLLSGLTWYLVSGRTVQKQTENMPMQMHHETHARMSLENGVVCPVTGTVMAPDKANSKMDYKGKTYYFCCASCPDKFKKNPGQYVK